jgi:hypothetical protein
VVGGRAGVEEAEAAIGRALRGAQTVASSPEGIHPLRQGKLPRNIPENERSIIENGEAMARKTLTKAGDSRTTRDGLVITRNLNGSYVVSGALADPRIDGGWYQESNTYYGYSERESLDQFREAHPRASYWGNL